MSALERNSSSLLLELPQRLLVAYARPVEKLTVAAGLTGPTPTDGHATSRGLVSRFLAAELKTRRGQQPLWLTFWVYGVAAAVQEALLVGTRSGC